jgi:sulfur carrier protein
MNIHINGQLREVAASSTVAALLTELGVSQPHIAVELNLEVIPRAEHNDKQLCEGDRLEVVTLVGGG